MWRATAFPQRPDTSDKKLHTSAFPAYTNAIILHEEEMHQIPPPLQHAMYPSDRKHYLYTLIW